MKKQHSNSLLRMFVCLQCLLIVGICSSCGGTASTTAPTIRTSPTVREPMRVASTPSPSPASQITGMIYVATQPALGTGGTITALLAQGGVQVWNFQTAVTYLSMSFDQGVIYASGSQLSAAGQARVYALNAHDGSLLWSTQLPGPGLSPPFLDNGVVYLANSLDGTVYALRSADGSLLWHTKTGIQDAGSSPLFIARGLLYVGSHTSGTVFALSSKDGHVIWSEESGQQGLSNITISGDTLYYLGVALDGKTSGVVHAVRANDGTEIWHREVGTITNLSLVFSQNALYLSTGTGEMLAVRASDGFQLWRVSLPGVDSGIASFQVTNGTMYAVANMAKGVFALRVSDGTQLWKYQDLQFAPLWGLTIGKGVVYVTGDSINAGNVFALGTMTGSRLWHFSLPSGGDFPSTVSMIPGAVVIAQTNTGKLFLWNLSGKEEWFFDLKCSDPVAPFPLTIAR